MNQKIKDKETDEWSDGYKGVSKVVVDTTNRKRKQPTPENKKNGGKKGKETARKTGNKEHGLRSSVASSKLTELRDHSCSIGPHKILAGLLGQSACLGLLVVQALSLVGMLIVVLDDTGWDLAGGVLLA